MTLKWGSQYSVELHPRYEEWLQKIREHHPRYSDEEILFAALVVGLDWLRRDEKLAWRLKKWFPAPYSTVQHFPHFAIQVLAGKIPVRFHKRPPRIYRGITFGDGQGPW